MWRIYLHVVNVFANIDNKSGLLSVKEALIDSSFDVDGTKYFVDALEICVTCINSRFNHQYSLQTDDAAQGPQLSFFLCQHCQGQYFSLANKLHLKLSVWKRFRDDIYVLWEHGTVSLSSFIDYLNTLDKTGKIKFTMEPVGDTDSEFLELKLKINNGKIRVDFLG